MPYSNIQMPFVQHESPGNSRPALNADLFRAPAAASPASSTVIYRARSSSVRHSDHSALLTPESPHAKICRATPRPSLAAHRASTSSHMTAESPSYGSLSSSTSYFGSTGGSVTPRDTGRKQQHHYVLAGQIETPGAKDAGDSVALDDDLRTNHIDVDHRRTMGYAATISSKRTHHEMEQDPLMTPTLRTVARILYTDVTAPDSPNLLPRWPGNGWTAFAVNTPINIIGRCVGRCWEFVKSSTFSGFEAGTGDAYPVRPNRRGNTLPRRVLSSNNLRSGLANKNPFGVGENGPQNFEGLRCEKLREQASTPSRPAVKRRQLSGTPRAAEDLQQWVVVDDAERFDNRGPRLSEYSTGAIRGPSASRGSRRSSVYRDINAQTLRDSSFPSNYAPPSVGSYTRRISVPVSRIASINGKTASRAASPAFDHRPSSRISHAGTSTLTSRQPASYAGQRSPATQSTAQFSSVTTTTPSRHPKLAIHTSPNVFARPQSTDPGSRRQSVSLSSPIRTPTNQGNRRNRTVSAASSSSSGSSAPPSRSHRRTYSAVTPTSRRRSVVPGAVIATKEDKAAVESDSPRISDNSKKILAQRRREERDADARMEALNAQLQDMIRQGKEALGTSFVVEMDGDEDDKNKNNTLKGASKAVAGTWVDDNE